jgi:hypothetical protein
MASVLVVKVASCGELGRATGGPNATPLSRKVTEPVGAGTPDGEPVLLPTLERNVTGCPTKEGLGELLNKPILDGLLFTVCVNGDEVLGL